MKGATIALISCALLSLEPVFSKMLLGKMSPLAIVTIYSLAGAVILFFLLEIERKLRELGRMTVMEVTALIALSLISGVVAQVLYVVGLKDTYATNAILLSRVNSLLIAFLGVVLLRERITLNHLVGGLLMAAGVYYITTEGLQAGVGFRVGDLYILAAAACWAVGNIIMKIFLCRVPPEVINMGRTGVAGMVLLFLASGDVAEVEWSVSIVAVLAGMVLLVVILGSTLWYSAFEHTDACTVGLISLTMPLFGVFYAVLMLGEVLSSYQVVGGFLIMVGLAVVEVHLATLVGWERRLLSRHLFHH